MNQWERNKDLDKQNSDSQTREQLPEKVLSFICNSGPPLESQPLSDARHQCPAKVKRALNEFLLLKAPPPAISQAGKTSGESRQLYPTCNTTTSKSRATITTKKALNFFLERGSAERGDNQMLRAGRE